MSASITIGFEDKLGPGLRRMVRELGPLARRNLNEAMGVEAQVLTADYLRNLGRHNTANRLGASPSNHLAKASEKVAQPSALSATDSEAVITIRHPGMSRAFKDVTIRPKNAKSLAIPMHALAYNRRAAELWTAMNLFIPKGSRYIAMAQGDRTVLMYVLVRSVTQTQDRTLLPSNEELQEAAARGAKNYIRASLQAAGKL